MVIPTKEGLVREREFYPLEVLTMCVLFITFAQRFTLRERKEAMRKYMIVEAESEEGRNRTRWMTSRWRARRGVFGRALEYKCVWQRGRPPPEMWIGSIQQGEATEVTEVWRRGGGG